MPPKRNSPAGFTLIELLVVVAIIGLLVALAFPVFAGMRAKSNDTKCLGNLRQLGTSALLYVSEHGFFPVSFETGNGTTNNWQAALDPYLKGAQDVKRCPAALLQKGDAHYSLNQNVFYDPSNPSARFSEPKRGALIEQPAEVILMMDGLQNSQGNAQGGMTQFRGSDGPGQRDAIVNPFQAQANDGKTGGGFPSYRHGNTKVDARRMANAVYADGHAAPAQWGSIKNRNLVFQVRNP